MRSVTTTRRRYGRRPTDVSGASRTPMRMVYKKNVPGTVLLPHDILHPYEMVTAMGRRSGRRPMDVSEIERNNDVEGG